MTAPASLWPSARERSPLALALAAARANALDRPGARRHASRDPRQRRGYATDPHAYLADVLGLTLTPPQEDALQLLATEPRLLLPSANNQGKTFLLGAWGVFVMDARAAIEDPDNGLPEQGARVLLPGPDHDTVFQTIYAEMLTMAARAEARGHLMPGERSEKSVLWRVRPKWGVEVFSPPQRVGQAVTHTASGRHHRNQVALIEEGQGVAEPIWRATEGMCSSDGNQIASAFNPTEASGPAYKRAQEGTYRVLHLDAFDHPNVRERRAVVPDAVDFKVIDARVRADCRDRGPYPGTPLEPEHGDFVYALPPRHAILPERGARADGFPGHPDAPLRVVRPNGAFTAQVRGQWPKGSDGGLFGTAELDAAMARGRLADVAGVPDAVGVDPAREGVDDATAAPRWGPGAAALLRAYADAEERGPAAIRDVVDGAHAVVGEITVLKKGDGVDTAAELHRRFPGSPFTMDEGGNASSPFDHLRRVLRRDVRGVSFGSAPLPRLPGEPWCVNLRTQLYVRMAMLVARGLADLPDDALLREEFLAHTTEPVELTREVEVPEPGHRPGERPRFRTVKKRVQGVALVSKDDVKRLIGRSPDRADAAVLAVFDPPPLPVAVLAPPEPSPRRFAVVSH